MKQRKNLGSPEIVFTKDWKELVRGELRRGAQFRITYDHERLPIITSTKYGMRTWSVVAYIKFNKSSEVLEKGLSTEYEQGKKDDPDSTIMTADLEIPGDAEGITMWFRGGDYAGYTYFDSRYGQNYHFSLIK